MMKIAAFPKCYLDIIPEQMSVFTWIEQSQTLGAEGLEMYERFFTSLEDAFIDRVGDALASAGYAMPMLCCSPDFTNPDPDGRRRAIEFEAKMIRITRRLGGPRACCRVLTGQRYPEVSVEQGLEWVIMALEQLIPVASEYDVILALENHYKDGFWKYPEFAQKQAVFMQVLAAIPERSHFGVQYDPSNALVAGDDPLELLRAVADRVVSVHASDRYLAPGVKLADLQQSDGTLGYAPGLLHGVTGQGLNDYDEIFAILAGVGYDGWISIEDGMNGMAEMKASIDFLKQMRAKYFKQ